jgi:hypothetical protein
VQLTSTATGPKSTLPFTVTVQGAMAFVEEMVSGKKWFF